MSCGDVIAQAAAVALGERPVEGDRLGLAGDDRAAASPIAPAMPPPPPSQTIDRPAQLA